MSARSSARIERRFPKPSTISPNTLENKALTETGQCDLARNLALLVQKHPDLEQILSAWPGLPEHIKTAIMALVQTHCMGKDGK